MTRVRTLSLVFVATVGLGLAACGSSSSSSTTTTGAATTTPPSTTPIATISDPSAVGTFGTEPTVTVPPGAPPTQLESKDLIVGTGKTAKDGDSVTVQYVGVSYSSGQVFDASWTDGSPFTFALGEGQVIAGWDQGVVGMRVGGRRELIIPPALAYGAQSPSPKISANDTLIFVVDLLKVN
jgi:peptidylprolyl isomerase